MAKVNAHGIQGDAAKLNRNWLAGRCQWVIKQSYSNQALSLSEFLVIVSSTHRCREAGLSMLYKVSSNSNHFLFSELPSASTRVRHNRAAAAAFSTLCLTPERGMGSRMQSTVGCFPELCFLQFSVLQVLVGL